MSNRELEKRLREYFNQTKYDGVDPAHLKKTVNLCIAVMRKQASAVAEPRQNFWGFLSDVFHFEGKSLLLPQLAVLLVTCHVAWTYSMRRGRSQAIPRRMDVLHERLCAAPLDAAVCSGRHADLFPGAVLPSERSGGGHPHLRGTACPGPADPGRCRCPCELDVSAGSGGLAAEVL